MNFLDNSLIISKLNKIFESHKESKILGFLNELDNKLVESFLGLRFKIWWRGSFIFNQFIKKEQEIKAFENSKIFNYFLNNLINASRSSWFVGKLF